MFDFLPQTPFRQELSRLAVDARTRTYGENPEAYSAETHAAAQQCVDYILKSSVEHQRNIFLELALKEPPQTPLKILAAANWVENVRKHQGASQRIEDVFKVVSDACCNEFAPGLRREGEHTREDDEAYIAPVVLGAMKVIVSDGGILIRNAGDFAARLKAACENFRPVVFALEELEKSPDLPSPAQSIVGALLQHCRIA